MGLPPPATPAEKTMAKRRRIIFKLLVFVLAGAIINVAVAWGVQCKCHPDS